MTRPAPVGGQIS